MNSTQRSNPDFATLAGVFVALGSVIGGLLLEGGSIQDVAQLTAGLMVVGGTLGAVLISTPFAILRGTALSFKLVFFDRPVVLHQVMDEMIHLATRARKEGLTSLEAEALAMKDPFMRKALSLVVDNTPTEQIRGIMELELDAEEFLREDQAKVFETAGGYAPTVGIIGAVLGLIQVMKHLENMDEVGRGIAVSFVATVYGVALANLILLPIAAKLRARSAHLTQIRELTLDGVIGIAELLNPTLLRLKLEPYVSRPKPPARQRGERPAPAARPVSSPA